MATANYNKYYNSDAYRRKLKRALSNWSIYMQVAGKKPLDEDQKNAVRYLLDSINSKAE